MTITTEQYKMHRDQRRGFTLVEIIITMSLLAIIIAGGLSAITTISQGSTALSNYSIMSTNGRQALEIIARDIRMGYDVNKATLTKLDFDVYGKKGTNNNIVYEYDAGRDVLLKTVDGGLSEIIIEDLSAFSFNYYNLRRISTTAPISIKEVQVEGILKRNSLSVSNTNHIISARFMMRNRAVSN